MDTGSSCSSGGEPEELQHAAVATTVEAVPEKKKRSAESKRFAKKRVVSVPIAGSSSSRIKGGGGEGALPPPSDSWAWRKYGQKPIKGSPYPRGYYRCSSSKGCPARKQVERSRTDPNTVVITYTSEHNHACLLLPKSHHRPKGAPPEPEAEAEPKDKGSAEELPAATDAAAAITTPSSSSPEGSFSADLTEETPPPLLVDSNTDHEFFWFPGAELAEDPTTVSYYCMPAAMLDGCSFGCGGGGNVGMLLGDDVELGHADGDDENSLFAGLEELPEFSIVFRRSSCGRRR